MGSINKSQPFGRETFRALLDFNDEALGGRLLIKKRGVFVRPPGPADTALTPEERRLRFSHPTGNLDEPALPFPFSHERFAAFCRSAPLFESDFVDPYKTEDGSINTSELGALRAVSKAAAELVEGQLRKAKVSREVPIAPGDLDEQSLTRVNKHDRKRRMPFAVVGVQVADQQHPPEALIANWSFWSRMTAAELWQAVALSLNRDPGAWVGPQSDDVIDLTEASLIFGGDVFVRRLCIASAALDAAGDMESTYEPPAADYRRPVRLHEFAALAEAQSPPWELPLEFPRPSPYPVSAVNNDQRKFWTIEGAATSLAKLEGWHDGARASLQDRMMEAARSGLLTVRDPHTDQPYRPAIVRSFYELVTPKDVNAWLASMDVDYRWRMKGPDAGPSEGAVSSPGPESGRRVHKLTPTRRDQMDPVIDEARTRSANSDDRAEVWSHLVAIAKSQNPSPPVVAFAEGEVSWVRETPNGPKTEFMSRKAFMQRWNRRLKRRDGSRVRAGPASLAH